jgi:hypothetical protein
MPITKKSEESSGRKLIITVFTTVIGALLVYWLIGPGGLIAKPSSPDIRILSLRGSRTGTYGFFDLGVEVHNPGGGAAERCYINWTFAGQSNFSPASDEFGLSPNETRFIHVSFYPGRETDIDVRALCSNNSSPSYRDHFTPGHY